MDEIDNAKKPVESNPGYVKDKKASNQKLGLTIFGVIIVILAIAAVFYLSISGQRGSTTQQSTVTIQPTTVAQSTSTGLSTTTPQGTTGTTTAPQLTGPCSSATTLYVGQNETCSKFRIQLEDLGEPNANDISPAEIGVYFGAVLTNTTQIFPGTLKRFSYSSYTLSIYVNQTNEGVYAYERWAKISLNVTG